MEYPKGTGKKVPKISVNRFFGISHNAVSKDGYFADCRNVVSEFPVIHTGSGTSAEETELTNITAMVKATGVDGFCGVAGGKVYWDGTELTVTEDSQFKPQANSEKHAYMFNKYMYIWERRESGKTVIYRYDTINRKGGSQNHVTQPGGIGKKAILYSMGSNGGHSYYTFAFPSSSSAPLVLDSTKKYIIAGAEDAEDIYMPIREFEYEYNNLDISYGKVAHTRYGSGTEYNDLYLYTKHNERIDANEVELETEAYFYEYGHYPMQATRPVLWKNRIWQGRLSGSAIIATAFDSAEDYYTFDNTSADSVEINVATEGEFIGVFAFNESLLAFKRNSITVIYGDTADDFAIGKTLEGVGVCDIKSVVSIGGRLYFCDGEAFYMYNGGFPRNISQNLKFKFTKCVAYSQEGRYVAEGTNESGSKIIYTYDTETGIWLAETPIGIKNVIRYEKDIYLITENGIQKPNGKKGWESAYPQWYVESADLYEEIFEKKGISEMFVRAKIGEGASVAVYFISERGEKTLIKTIYGNGRMQTYRIPIAYSKQEVFRYRLEGSGAAMIYDIERSVPVGGRNISEFNN